MIKAIELGESDFGSDQVRNMLSQTLGKDLELCQICEPIMQITTVIFIMSLVSEIFC